MQVVLVYLKWLRRSSLLKCAWQPKIAKKITINPIYFGVQGCLRSSLLVPPKVLVMISSKSVCLSATVLTLDELIVVK